MWPHEIFKIGFCEKNSEARDLPQRNTRISKSKSKKQDDSSILNTVGQKCCFVAQGSSGNYLGVKGSTVVQKMPGWLSM